MRTDLNYLITFAITIFLVLGGTSCSKFRENREYFTLYDHESAEEAYNDMIRLTCQEASRFSALLKDSCYTVTVSDTSYPQTYTFAFGSTDCTDIYEIKRRGSMTITFSQNFANAGAVATITPGSDYYFQDYKVTGPMTLTNAGLDNTGHQLYTMSVPGSNLETPNNQPYTWSCNHAVKVYYVAPGGLIFGDVIHYTGTASGVDHEGFSFTTTIDDSLAKEQTCRWPNNGNITINIKGLEPKEVNYGDNNCAENNEVNCCVNVVYVKTDNKRGQSLELN